jgi:hypothetical protein
MNIVVFTDKNSLFGVLYASSCQGWRRVFAQFGLINVPHIKVLSVLWSTHYSASVLLTHLPSVELMCNHCVYLKIMATITPRFWLLSLSKISVSFQTHRNYISSLDSTRPCCIEPDEFLPPSPSIIQGSQELRSSYLSLSCDGITCTTLLGLPKCLLIESKLIEDMSHKSFHYLKKRSIIHTDV